MSTVFEMFGRLGVNHDVLHAGKSCAYGCGNPMGDLVRLVETQVRI
jgi:hypothetical protein